LHQKENITARCRRGKDLKSCCKTPFAASRDRTQIRARETALTGQDVGAVPSEPTCSLCSPSRKKAPRCSRPRPFPETPPVQAGPRPSWVLGAAGLASPLLRTPILVSGVGKRKPGLALPAAPSAGGLPHPPSCQGLPAFYDGPDSRFILHPLQHHHLPPQVSQGPSELSLDPHSTPLAGRGRDPGGFTIKWGPQEVRGSNRAHSPANFLPAHS